MREEIEELKDMNILQHLYDEAIIDFSGDEEELTLHTFRTGRTLLDCYKLGYKKKEQLVNLEVLKVLQDVENRIKLCLKDTNKHKEKGMPQGMNWKSEALGYKTSIQCIQRTREKFKLNDANDEGGETE